VIARRTGGLLAACLVLTFVGEAHAQENDLNPGQMGANALPPQPGEGPWVEDAWSVLLSAAAQQAWPGDARDHSLTFPFRVDYAFAQRVSLFVEGSPVEAWTRTLPRSQGVTKGDLRVGARFLFYEGDEWLPGIALRAVTKTTTGKGVEDRRFINAPGYLFDLIAGKRFKVSESLQLEGWLAAGFFAWQQAGFGQNDAFSWSATALAHLPSGSLRLEARGYQGWQTHDKPLVLSAGVELPLFGQNSFLATLNYGVRDPVLMEVRVGVRLAPPAPQAVQRARAAERVSNVPNRAASSPREWTPTLL
jgi:hypothetical protein